jgi:uncharacterized protein (DUF362 family)
MIILSKKKYNGDIKKTVGEAVGLLGGMDKFVRPGEVVLLKPNFNTADPPPASSEIDFLKAVVELCYEAGAKMVMIGESSTMSLNTRKVLEKRGVYDLLNMPTPPRIYIFEEGRWVKRMIPGTEYLTSVTVPEILDRADKLILLPNLKTHFQARFTGALKLAVGFMKPIERVPLHLRNIEKKIGELNKVINPTLVIMDARKCFIAGGPARGDIAVPNLVLASESRVAVDVEEIKIIQGFDGNELANIDPWELPQIKMAIESGLGPDKEQGYKSIGF